MIQCTLESSPVDWIIEYPETTMLLERLGIDCSCPGKSLAFSCHRLGLDPDQVLQQLHRCINPGDEVPERQKPNTV